MCNSAFLFSFQFHIFIFPRATFSILFSFTEEVNPWLARSSTTTTNLNTLPGKRSNDPIFTLPSQFASKDSSQWLVKSTPKPKKETPENYEDWLWVPKTEKSTKNLLDPWLEKSSTMSWTSSGSKVEEWLENALEDVTDDFDDCSIEIISQWNLKKKHPKKDSVVTAKKILRLNFLHS